MQAPTTYTVFTYTTHTTTTRRSYKTESAAIAAADRAVRGAYILGFGPRTRATFVAYRTGMAA